MTGDRRTVLKYGTYVLAGGELCLVYCPTTLGGASGYNVQSLERSLDKYPNFAPDWCVHPAVIGENVCERPRFTCFCGYKHVRDPNRLPRVAERESMDGDTDAA